MPGILKILVKLLKTNKLSNLWVNGIKDSFSPLGVIDKKASSQITNLYFFIIFSNEFFPHNWPVGLWGFVIQITSPLGLSGNDWGKILFQFFGNSQCIKLLWNIRYYEEEHGRK